MSDIEAALDDVHLSQPGSSHYEDEEQFEEFAVSRPSAKGPAKHAVVGIMDNSEVTVNCPQGKYITAGELRDRVAELIGLDESHKELFALWVISGALQLQLKLYHTPFKVLKKWSELISAFSDADPFSEIPVFFLKRDAMVHQGVERKVKDPLTRRLLFHEMTFNVVNSIYPCSLEEASKLAAIHLMIRCGLSATKEDVALIDECKVPLHLKSQTNTKKWSKMVLEDMFALPVQPSNVDGLISLYLERGWVWSYYGAVFFQGEIEYPENKTLWRETPNEVVRVGVNLEGIHIINDKDNTVKLSLPYGKLRYNSQEDPEDGDGCFIVEFSLDDAPHLAPKKSKSSDVSRTQTLTIWTRQAAMIDALATRYLDELDKWQDYLREKTLLRTQQQDRRIVQRGTGLTATLSRFIGKSDNNPRAGFTLSKFRFLSKKASRETGLEPTMIANRYEVNEDGSAAAVQHDL